ncbi:hypothetical protein [Pseudobdellovibrio exovorus]|uniref:Uncharacterized protein n=1 Tax=Pseudobdellovibrio exovorus JSS TaxID=1184267 RepID=M4VMM6_9BACT|nr:hypothetical protein [Pseudobdellovibrio exovorus]AGH94339.1 hypothetical protein A11Q_119 [Pseudobdellovibrio exovorus JSS]
MKSILVLSLLTLSVTLPSVSSFAQKYDGDMGEIYLSWCEQGNVIQNSLQGPVIKKNCAASQQVCKGDQRTSGKNVIYTATCADADVRYGRE